jgi:hypothetical protein
MMLDGNWSYNTVCSRKIQNSKILIPDLYGRLYWKIVSPGFLDNFTKNCRHDLKIGYIDACTHGPKEFDKWSRYDGYEKQDVARQLY